MGLPSSQSRWTLIAVLPFLSIGAGLLLLLVDLVLALVVAGLGLFVLTPILSILFAFWPLAGAEETAADADESPVDTRTGAQVETATQDGRAREDDVDTLRQRYVDGEFSEAEFERRLEETLGDDEGDASGTNTGSTAGLDRELE